MLHHGDIALLALLFKVCIVFFNVAEFNFLVFFGTGEYRRSSEGGIKRRFAFGFVAISDQLHIQLRRDAGTRHIHNVMLDFNGIATAREHIGFDKFDFTYRFRFKGDL